MHLVLLWRKSSDALLKINSWIILFDLQISFNLLESTLLDLVVIISSLLESLLMTIRLSIATLNIAFIETP